MVQVVLVIRQVAVIKYVSAGSRSNVRWCFFISRTGCQQERSKKAKQIAHTKYSFLNIDKSGRLFPNPGNGRVKRPFPPVKGQKKEGPVLFTQKTGFVVFIQKE
jgi:hypothetical protein